MIKCCVCLNDAEAVGKSRCRKIHGSSCEAEKHYLEKLAMDSRGVRLNRFLKIGPRKDATICYQCLQKLKKCTKMERDLQALKQEMISFLNNLSVERDVVMASTGKRKVSNSAQERSSKVLRREQESFHQEQPSDTETVDYSSESDNDEGEGTSYSETCAQASPDVLVSYT